MRYDRRFLALLAYVVPPFLLIDTVEAQFTGCPSYIEIMQYPSSPYCQSTADFVVEYGDLLSGFPPCFSFGNTHDTSTFKFYVNTINRRSFFTTGFTSANGTNVPLEHEETNVLIAEITGWDENNVPRTDRDTIVMEVDTTPPPVVSVAFNTFDNQSATLCANACFAATYAQSTVPYFTLDQPRSVTLAYHGDRLAPHPFIYADVDAPFGSRVPVRFWIEVKHNGAALPFTNGDTRLYFAGDSQPVRLAGQLKMNTLSTGIYPMQVVVTTQYSDSSTEEVTTSVPWMVVNERNSPIARGWTLAGVQRLHSSGDTLVMITEGDGSALLFRRTCGDPCVFTTPDGDYSKLTASGVGSGRTYVRAYTDSSRAIFDHLGRLTKVIRYPADTTEFAYDGTSRLTKIYDPFRRYNGGANKSYIALSYGSYGLQSIKEPGPDGGTTGGRTTYVTVVDSALRAIKDPDGDSTRFTYDDSLRLSTVTDRRGSTTTYGYDNRSWKLTSVTLPQVPIDAGGGTTTNVSPVTAFSPWQIVGVPTSQTSAQSPATGLKKADTVTASVTDAEGRVTRYTVNKWGLPLKTTDPLGRITTVYRGAGFGVLADSVVFYTGAVDRFQYSGQFLVYEHREGKNPINYRYAGWGLIDKIWGTNYVTKEMGISAGRVQWIRLAGMDSLKTEYDYDARGRLTAVTQPRGQVTQYHYEAILGNQDSLLAPAGRFSRTRFDSKGRDSLMQANGFPWQLVTYDVMNRVSAVHDSVGISAPTTYTYDELFLTDARDPLGQLPVRA